MNLCPICKKAIKISGSDSLSNPAEHDFKPCHFNCHIPDESVCPECGQPKVGENKENNRI